MPLCVSPGPRSVIGTTVRVSYQTIEFGDLDIHVRTLRDKQQYSDDDGVAAALGISDATWPLFGIIWPSGHALAELMVDYDIAGKRVLEVGCGIALASLVLNHREADITSTDYHPEVSAYLSKNVALNDGAAIPFIRTGWADEAAEDLGLFDLIIASDVLYDDEHALDLSEFIASHGEPICEVIVVDPGRGNLGAYSRKMAVHGFETTRRKHSWSDHDEKSHDGHILTSRRG